MPNTEESLAVLLRRYRDRNEKPGDAPRASFIEAVRCGDGALDMLPLSMLLAIAEINEEKPELRREFVSLADALGLRIGVIQLETSIGALVRKDGSPVLCAELDPEGPHGEAFVDVGSPPDPRVVRLINIVIGAPEESLDGGEGDDRIFRHFPDGKLRFGFGEGVTLFPGDARGMKLQGTLHLSLSPSAGCWFICGEDAE